MLKGTKINLIAVILSSTSFIGGCANNYSSNLGNYCDFARVVESEGRHLFPQSNSKLESEWANYSPEKKEALIKLFRNPNKAYEEMSPLKRESFDNFRRANPKARPSDSYNSEDIFADDLFRYLQDLEDNIGKLQSR